MRAGMRLPDDLTASDPLLPASDPWCAPLQVVDVALQWHGALGGGDYFLGPQYSLAEVCCTGFVQRALLALPHFRGVDVWGLAREQGLGR